MRLSEQYEGIRVAQYGPVLEITIDRPEVRNCLTPANHEALSHIFDVFEHDDALRVAIITGAGGVAFCAGNDLKYGASGKPMYIPPSGFGGLTNRRGRSKPIIAAVNGFATGGGLEIVLACDLVVADETATFSLPEVKVGLLAGAGGIVRLARQIPRKRAVELIVTGRSFSASEGLAWGLLSEVAPAGEALAAARKLADAIVANAPLSISLSLRALVETDQYASADDAAAAFVRSPLLDELVFSEDMREGMQAFAEKRAPRWTGR